MSNPIELTSAEAEAVCRMTTAALGGKFDELDIIIRLNAMAGVIGVARALQELGFRLSRPLTEAKAADGG